MPCSSEPLTCARTPSVTPCSRMREHMAHADGCSARAGQSHGEHDRDAVWRPAPGHDVPGLVVPRAGAPCAATVMRSSSTYSSPGWRTVRMACPSFSCIFCPSCASRAPELNTYSFLGCESRAQQTLARRVRRSAPTRSLTRWTSATGTCWRSGMTWPLARAPPYSRTPSRTAACALTRHATPQGAACSAPWKNGCCMLLLYVSHLTAALQGSKGLNRIT